LQGSGWINLADDPTPVALHAGDCYLLPRGSAFTLRDRLDSPTQNFENVLSQIEGRTLRYGAAADHQIGSALRALHEQSAHAWTIEALASTVNMSRSAFALRFKSLIGEAPMEYLTRCRIQKASRLLHESDLTISQIADSVGYESETSFNKAFKRRIGVPPGRFREQRTVRNA